MMMGSRKSIWLILAGVGVLGLVIYLGSWAFEPDPVDSLSSSDPVERGRAIAVLSSSADSDAGLDRIAEAVKHKNPAVACGALRAMTAGAGPDKPLSEKARKIAEDASLDTRPAVGVAAIQVLQASTPKLPEDPTVPNIVLKTLRQTGSDEVKAAAANALAKFAHWGAVEALIDEMESESVEVRAAAGMAVQNTLGLDYGFKADARLPERRAIVARLRREWKHQRRFYDDYVARVRNARKGKQ